MKRLFLFSFAVMMAVACAVPGARAKADDLPDAVVFYDKQFPVSWMQRSVSLEVNEFMGALGFTTLDSEGVVKWMSDAVAKGARGRLLVMAHDIAPAGLVGDAPSSPALFRKYLDAGGNVIWVSDVPFYFIGMNKKEKTKWDYLGGRGVLGFDTVGNWQESGESKPAKTGEEWGLKGTWSSNRAVKTGDVTNVLATSPSGAAAAWTKQYADGQLGFIRLWDGPVSNISDDMFGDLFKVAAKVLPRLESVKRKGDIYLFQPSEYYPLVRREGDGLIRDIQVSVFDSTPAEGTSYVLKVMRNGKELSKTEIDAASRVFMKKNLQVQLLYPDEELVLFSVAGGRETEIKRVKLAESAFFCGVETSGDPLVNPVDIGHMLVPNDYLLVSKTQKIKLDSWMLFPGDAVKHKVAVSAPIVNKDGAEVLKLAGDFDLTGGAVKQAGLTADAAALEPGKYSMTVSFSEGGKELYSEKRMVIVEEKKPAARGFGAYYTDLVYDGPVPIYDRKAEKWSTDEWKDLWRRGPYQDIVVSFPNGNRFVFWRGSSNVPFWASPYNVGMTYEWVEAQWGRGGLVDCIEPLQDKKCIYSRPYIVSSTPARTVINWRYALIDLDYTIADEEWAEETYIFYPDGFGVRQVKANVLPMTWHESNEMIVFIPSAINPFDVLPTKAVRILSLDGPEAVDVSYPQPKGKWGEKTPTVFRISYSKKDRNTPTLVSWKFNNFIQQYDGWKVDGRYICPSYWGVHYPVTRGYPTTIDAPPGWRERPGHASLITINTEPFSQKRVNAKLEQIVWAWMIGNTDMPDAQLIDISRSWTKPAPVEILEGGDGGSFDQFQRGYVIRTNGAASAKLRFKGNGNSTMFDPVFILKDFAGENAIVKVNGAEPKQYKVSRESTYTSDALVVWIGEDVRNNAVVEIIKK